MEVNFVLHGLGEWFSAGSYQVYELTEMTGWVWTDALEQES